MIPVVHNVQCEVRPSQLRAFVHGIHEACGADMHGLFGNMVYLPLLLSFGTFRGLRIGGIPQPPAMPYHTNNRGTYLGLDPEWLTGYFGWYPLARGRMELDWNHNGDWLVIYTYEQLGEQNEPPYERLLAPMATLGRLVGAATDMDDRHHGCE